MKRWTTILISVVLAIGLILVGCGNNPEESLRERATQWSTMLLTLQTSGEEQAVKQIEGFLEPSAARAERAKEYYTDWAKSKSLWKTVLFSVDDVSIDPDKVHGTVRLTVIVEWTGPETFGVKTGARQTQTQIIKWKLIDNVWYRTLESAERK